MTPLFAATQRFDPSDGERWERYVRWAQIPQLVELVSLDIMLCPTLVREFPDEGWKHSVQENDRLNYFYDLDYLARRTAGVRGRNILGLYRNPNRHIDFSPGSGAFEFMGYDLVEEATQISAISNCGGFPETFSNDELNRFGLITDFSRATEIQKLLPLNNPQEDHAQCALYAIWRLDEDAVDR